MSRPGGLMTMRLWLGCSALVLALGCMGEPVRTPAQDKAALQEDSPSHEELCRSLAQQYAAALPQALVCDPASEVCSETRPVAVGLVDASGSHIQGLAHCRGPVNGARTAVLDGLLLQYLQARCELGDPPGCPMEIPNPETGKVPTTPFPCYRLADGGGACYP